MIIRDKNSVTIFLEQGRELRMSHEEFNDLRELIVTDRPLIEITNPIKPWSPCSGEGCTHTSHENEDQWTRTRRK